MDNTEEDSPHMGSKQGEEEDIIKPDVNHQRILQAFTEHNMTATSRLTKMNEKLKDGLIDGLEMSKSVNDAASYICEAQNNFVDTQGTLEFYKDLDPKSDMKSVLKKLLISYYSSITELLQSVHLILHVLELGNANPLNANESNADIIASSEKLSKFVDELVQDVSIDEIYRILPASDVLCARLINKTWHRACTSNYLSQIQPACGGSIPLGFLLANDKLQRRAAAGMRMRHHFKGLEEKFPARDARIVASSCGLHLVHLRNPDGMVVLNPTVGQTRAIYPPVSIGESIYTGMAVSFADGLQVATRYCAVVPYCPPFINAFAPDPRIRFRIWSSVEGVWRINPHVIELEDFSPRNVVTVGQIIYFHISRDELIFYDVDQDMPGQLGMPVEVAGLIEVAVCTWKRALGILSYDMVNDHVQIYTLEDNAWIHKENIKMKPIVELNRLAFRSLALDLRSRIAEEATEALMDLQLVGYVDPGWLLIRQRNGWVLINILAKTARRVRLGEVQCIFFGSRVSSFLRLS